MVRRSKVQYACNVVNDMSLTGEKMGGKLTGFDINGTMAFCVKRNEATNESVLYRMNSYSNATVPSGEKKLSIKSYGMTYFSQNLYITTDNNKIAKVSYDVSSNAGAELFDVVTLDGEPLNSTAIANVSGTKFILMANAFNESGYLCFSECKMNTAAKTFEETRRFYVRSSGYTEIKDIYYDIKYGLFIVTNKTMKNGIANSNLILQVSPKRVETNGHNNKDLYYPVAQYYFVAKEKFFTSFNIESVAIASGENVGTMYAVANVVNSNGTISDRLLHFDNFRFYVDKTPFNILTDSTSSVAIPVHKPDGETYKCENAGAMALDGEIGYCLESYTADEETNKEYRDKASVLLRTLDINSVSFETYAPKNGVYTNMGHGNGMTYHDGALYIAAYIREDIKNGIAAMQHIVKISTEGALLGEYELEKDSCIGSISHYSGDLFILGEYNSSETQSYAREPKFYIGYFENGKFVTTKTFSVTNPTYSSVGPAPGKKPKNYLQDIHYDSEFGLYYVTYTNGVSHMYRVLPERIENADGSEILEPDEQFEFKEVFGEAESLSISVLEGQVGSMYVAGNNGNAHKVAGFKFYRSDLEK